MHSRRRSLTKRHERVHGRVSKKTFENGSFGTIQDALNRTTVLRLRAGPFPHRAIMLVCTNLLLYLHMKTAGKFRIFCFLIGRETRHNSSQERCPSCGRNSNHPDSGPAHQPSAIPTGMTICLNAENCVAGMGDPHTTRGVRYFIHFIRGVSRRSRSQGSVCRYRTRSRYLPCFCLDARLHINVHANLYVYVIVPKDIPVHINVSVYVPCTGKGTWS